MYFQYVIGLYVFSVCYRSVYMYFQYVIGLYVFSVCYRSVCTFSML